MPPSQEQVEDEKMCQGGAVQEQQREEKREKRHDEVCWRGEEGEGEEGLAVEVEGLRQAWQEGGEAVQEGEGEEVCGEGGERDWQEGAETKVQKKVRSEGTDNGRGKASQESQVVHIEYDEKRKNEKCEEKLLTF